MFVEWESLYLGPDAQSVNGQDMISRRVKSYVSDCCRAGVKPDCGHPSPSCNKCNLPCEAVGVYE